MKVFALTVLVTILTACGSGGSDEPREPTAGAEIASDYNRQMQKAENVELQLQDQKAAIDAAIEASDQGTSTP